MNKKIKSLTRGSFVFLNCSPRNKKKKRQQKSDVSGFKRLKNIHTLQKPVLRAEVLKDLFYECSGLKKDFILRGNKVRFWVLMGV